jgi:hypothetical protein
MRPEMLVDEVVGLGIEEFTEHVQDLDASELSPFAPRKQRRR